MIEWMAARASARNWLPAMAGALAVAGPIFLLGQCSGVEIERGRQAAAQTKAVETVGRADIAAAAARAEDRHRIAQTEKEQSRAIQSAPDQKPGPGRLQRACLQLRLQQTAPERLPAECRPEG